MEGYLLKRIRKGYGLLAGLMLSVPLFLSSGISALAAEEVEPNYSADNATQIPVNEDCVGVISEYGDVDYYVVTLDQAGVISLDFTNDFRDTNNCFGVTLIGAAAGDLWGQDIQGRNLHTVSSPKYGVEAGSYYVKVTGNYVTGLNYTIKVNYETANDWEAELNDAAGAANVIVPGSSINGNIYKYGDADYYKVNIDQPGKISFEFSNEYRDSSNVWNVSLIGEATEELYSRDIAGKNLDTVSSPEYGVRAGTYYLKVVGNYLQDLRYTVKLNYTALADWEEEKNDSFDDANEIVPGKSYNGNIYRYGDVDSYKFTINQPGKVSVNFSNEYYDTGNKWSVSLMRTSGDSITSMEVAGKNLNSVSTKECDLDPGTYYVKVTGNYIRHIRYTINVGYSSKTAGAESFVARLYQVGLGRDPEPQGLTDWTNKLVNGEKNAVDIVQGVLCSAEYAGYNKSHGQIVTDCYNAMLGRNPDDEGFASWTNRLENGMSVDAIFAGFVGSEEFKGLCDSYGIKPGTYPITKDRDRNAGVTLFVSRLYTQALGRGYDVDGLDYWCKQINDNPTKENILKVSTDGFFHSSEFLEKNLSNEEFCKVLYRTYLGREYDEAGLNTWVRQLNDGTKTRDQVMEGFAYSEEFANIRAQYGLG